MTASTMPTTASTMPTPTTMTRHIFQTWRTQDVPEQWRGGQHSMVLLNSGYKYTLLTDQDNERLIAEHFPWFQGTFQGFKYGIQRADAVRYALLYLFGGVYVDLDYACLQPFEAALAASFAQHDILLVPSTNVGAYVTNSFMAARLPGHPFWLECMHEMLAHRPVKFMGKHMEVFTSTGPFMLNRVYQRSGSKYRIDVRSDLVVPCSVCQYASECPPSSASHILMPLQGGTWMAWDSKLYNALYCHWRLYLCLLALAVAIIIVLIRIVRLRARGGVH